MEKMFFWMQDPIDMLIKEDKWAKFLEFMSMVSVITIGVTVVLIVVFYALSARARKIHQPGDLFAPYTPMYWLLLSLIACLVVGVVCASYYHADLDPKPNAAVDGLFVVSTELALWTGLWTFLLSYILIAFTPCTPPKFKYRPRWLFVRSKGVRAGT
jgi:heme/copper-type cytochrome/quinol oxidase subunit 2